MDNVLLAVTIIIFCGLQPIIYLSFVLGILKPSADKHDGSESSFGGEVVAQLLATEFILIPVLIVTYPIVIVGCLLGFFQRKTRDSGIKTMCNLIGVLGLLSVITFFSWYYY